MVASGRVTTCDWFVVLLPAEVFMQQVRGCFRQPFCGAWGSTRGDELLRQYRRERNLDDFANINYACPDFQAWWGKKGGLW